jgi:hypothetical protein
VRWKGRPVLSLCYVLIGFKTVIEYDAMLVWSCWTTAVPFLAVAGLCCVQASSQVMQCLTRIFDVYRRGEAVPTWLHISWWYFFEYEPDSSISAVTGYGLGDRGLVHDRSGGFFLYRMRPASSGAHGASCEMGMVGLFPGGKVWLRRDAAYSPRSSVDVKKDGLHLLSPQEPFMACNGSTVLLLLQIAADLRIHPLPLLHNI